MSTKNPNTADQSEPNEETDDRSIEEQRADAYDYPEQAREADIGMEVTRL